jgi:protoporphyrinogen oxidase
LTVILGAGITGLSVAYHLKEKNHDFIIIEKEKNPGGLCRNINIEGYIFNYTGHFLHCKTAYVRDLAVKLVPRIKTIKRNSYVYLDKRVIPYPIQSNEEYLSPVSRIKSSIGYLIRNKREPRNLDDWFIYNFGRGLYSIFFKPYNEKLLKYPLKDIVPDFLTGYVPKNSQTSSRKNIGYNAEFLYPDKGIGELVSSISRGIKISRGEVRKVDKRYVYFNSGKIKYENLVSTIPLPEFLKLFRKNGEKFESKNGDLVWNSVLCLNIGIKGKFSFGSSIKKSKDSNFNPSQFHWIYFPDKNFPFYRIGSLSNVSPQLAPDDCSSVWVEISYRKNKPGNKIIDTVIKSLEQIGLCKKEAIAHVSEVDILYAYPIYDKNREKIIKEIKDFLEKCNITLVGRFGEWQYSYIEESILEGKRIAEKLCRQ